MTRFMLITVLGAAFLPPFAWGQRTETETFEGDFSNEYFNHELDYPSCCFEFVYRAEADSVMLHLVPNSDAITFDGAFTEIIHTVRVDILDFEGGFVGYQPTSVLIALGSTGDFVFRNAKQIGALETLEITEETPGQLTGFPIGPILGVRLDAANEGNSVYPAEVGAYFDNLVAEVREFGPPCPGDVDGDLDVDLADLTVQLSHFGTLEGATYEEGDLDLDGDVDLSDLALLLANFGSTCR